MIVWGEAQAIGVLSSQTASQRAHGAVIAALVTEAVLLGLEPAVAFLRSAAAQVPSRYERYVDLTLRVLLISVGLALVVVGVILFTEGT